MKKLILVVPLLLTACATPTLQTPNASPEEMAREAEQQRKFVVQRILEQQARIYTVMFRLTTGNEDLCGTNLTGSIGAYLTNSSVVAPEFRSVAQSDFGLNSGLTIEGVISGGPANQAGLMSGDHIVSIGGENVNDASRDAEPMRKILYAAAASRSPVTVVVSRGNENQNATVTPVLACNYPASLVESNNVNAFSDGTAVFVTTGLVNFAQTEQELAVVISHEISHNILGHIDKKKENATVGALAGLAIDILVVAKGGGDPGLSRTGAEIGAGAYSVEFEKEADYEGMYLMARAGYPLDGAQNIWRKMAANNPDSITMRTDHPTTPERFLALQSAINEIESKQAQHLALLPNLKNGVTPDTGTAYAGRDQQGSPSVSLQAVSSAGSQPITALRSGDSTSGQAQSALTLPFDFGVNGSTVIPKSSRSASSSTAGLNMPDPHGVFVSDVKYGSPARAAGIKPGDIIYGLNGQRIVSLDQLNSLVSKTHAGTTISLDIWHVDDKTEKISVTL